MNKAFIILLIVASLNPYLNKYQVIFTFDVLRRRGGRGMRQRGCLRARKGDVAAASARRARFVEVQSVRQKKRLSGFARRAAR